MADIVLTTQNAKYAHASLGLRYLLANLGPLGARAVLVSPSARIDQLFGSPDPRNPTSRICICVPNWNIEAWVLWLAGEEVDESRSYKTRLRDEDFASTLAEAIAKWEPTRSGEATEHRLLGAGQTTRRVGVGSDRGEGAVDAGRSR